MQWFGEQPIGIKKKRKIEKGEKGKKDRILKEKNRINRIEETNIKKKGKTSLNRKMLLSNQIPIKKNYKIKDKENIMEIKNSLLKKR
jgi:hypothetical protein